jgi:hypothetical protein
VEFVFVAECAGCIALAIVKFITACRMLIPDSFCSTFELDASQLS